MKKTIPEEPVFVETKYFCDVHPNVECYSQVEAVSWYGSKFDMMKLELHLCDKCLTELYAHMKEKYNVEPKDVIL